MNDKLLEDWRKQIDKLDDELLDILAKRLNIVRKIGSVKKEHKIKPLDEKRWQEVMQSKRSKAYSLNLSNKFVEELYNLIHKYSLKIERNGK